MRRYAARLGQLHAGLFAPQRDHRSLMEKEADIVRHLADHPKTDQMSASRVRFPRVNILGVGVTPVNLAQTVEILEKWRAEGRREYVCCTSVHGLVEAQRDPEIRSALNRSGLTTEDGMPLVWWCQRSGYSSAGRVCGTDLLLAMCERAAQRGHRHLFLRRKPSRRRDCWFRASAALSRLGRSRLPIATVPPANAGGRCCRCPGHQRNPPRFRLGGARNAKAREMDGAARR